MTLSDTLLDLLQDQGASTLDRVAREAGARRGVLPQGSASGRQRAQALVDHFEGDLAPLVRAVNAALPWARLAVPPPPPATPQPPAVGLSEDRAVLRFGRFDFSDGEQASVHLRGDVRTEVFAAPWTEEALAEQLAALAGLDAGDPTQQTLAQAGRRLARGFKGEVYRSLEGVAHLLIASEPRADDVQRLPWELLLWPEANTPFTLDPGRAVLRQVARSQGRPPAEGAEPCVLFAWSEAGGSVPHARHRARLDEGALPVEELPHATPATLRDRLQALGNAGRPAWWVHLLCHGTPTEPGLPGLAMGSGYDGPRPSGASLGQTLAHAPAPALLSVAACQRPDMDAGVLGPMLAALARSAGVPVLGCQLPFEKRASVDALRAMVRAWGAGRAVVEIAQAAVHAVRDAHGETADWAALTLTLPVFSAGRSSEMPMDTRRLQDALCALGASELGELATISLGMPPARMPVGGTLADRAQAVLGWAAESGRLDALRAELRVRAPDVMS
ncbi:MAG: hypothetical protein H6739_12240 [Alphaproteobacteria bacterium]|nr:hypothetical protein [Alphaproteobacteria bacterium]